MEIGKKSMPMEHKIGGVESGVKSGDGYEHKSDKAVGEELEESHTENVEYVVNGDGDINYSKKCSKISPIGGEEGPRIEREFEVEYYGDEHVEIKDPMIAVEEKETGEMIIEDDKIDIEKDKYKHGGDEYTKYHPIVTTIEEREMSDIIVMDEEPNDEKDGCEIDGEKYVEDKNVEQTHYNKNFVKIKLTAVFTWRGWRQ